MKSPGELIRGALARAHPYAPALVVSAGLGSLSVRGILDQTSGVPAVPLDDSFIHFQFARRAAEGHPFTFTEGAGFSSGATSFLWPLMLAPFHALGLRELSLVWAAWGLGTVLHAATAVETARLATPLVGRGAGIAAGLMSALFAAFAWFAWSGMETIALAWILARAARVASEWSELPAHERTPRRGLGSVALAGAIGPLVRPEGALAAAMAAAALALWPARPAGSLDSRRDLRIARVGLLGLPLVPVLAILLVPLLSLALTGHAGSSTSTVKWLVGNPYYAGSRLWDAVGANLRLMGSDLLVGGTFTAIFVPRWSLVPIALGIPAAFHLAARERRWARAVFVVVLALATLATASYLTMLWNRVRYIWPFAPAWFVLVAAAAASLGRLAERWWTKEAGYVGAILAGAYAGALADKLPWALSDLAQSAAAIHGQQVKLGLWARRDLPEEAILGVNDTGAIAYLSGRRTFDVVGLTTEGEARHWVGGAGARFEHYERLPREALPTHFIVYPQWMQLPTILGAELESATVTDQSILGGATKTAYEARWQALGSGATPGGELGALRIVAQVDVADLESEARAGYALGDGWDTDCVVVERGGDDTIADGARLRRERDAFRVDLPKGRARLAMRLSAEEDTAVVVSAAGRDVGEVEVAATDWGELSIELGELPGGPTAIEVRSAPGRGRFGAMHYWLLADP